MHVDAMWLGLGGDLGDKAHTGDRAERNTAGEQLAAIKAARGRPAAIALRVLVKRFHPPLPFFDSTLGERTFVDLLIVISLRFAGKPFSANLTRAFDIFGGIALWIGGAALGLT